MEFLKRIFKDNSVIGLSGLRKRSEFVKVNIPESYKKTYISQVSNNYLLIWFRILLQSKNTCCIIVLV